MHSTHSDGQWTPDRLVRSAAEQHLRAIALTDHDTVRGVGEAKLAGEAAGVEVITGAEISTWLDADVHLLAYGFDPETEGLKGILDGAREARYDRAVRMRERLAELGIPITLEDVLNQAGDAAIGRPHLARALVAGGHVGSFREAFDVYLGDGKPACVEKVRVEPGRAIEAIHRAGGVAVAAHPGFYGGPEFLDPLVDAGLDGVEVRHSLHDEGAQADFERYAASNGLFPTGGSDFHGPGPGRSGVGSVTIPYEWVEVLRERVAARRAASDTDVRRI